MYTIKHYLFIKTFFDKLVTLLLLLTLSPIFLIIIPIQIWAYGSKDIFFVQQRVGKGHRLFHIIKFTTLFPSHQDRENPWGNFLRKTHLDELPQLVNVLRGDMSMVGPRPLLPEYLPYYTKKEKLRHSAHVGITGLAQVDGGQSLDWRRKMALDHYYIKHLSFSLDMYILYRTFLKLFDKSTKVSYMGRADHKDRPY